MKAKATNLTEYQLTILQECARFSLCANYGRAGLIRLGGHGMSPLIYRRDSFRALQILGLLEFGSVYKITSAGKMLLAELASTQPQP